MERSIFMRRTFRLVDSNVGFLGLGVRIEMLVDGEVVLTEVVRGYTLYAIGQYSRALVKGEVEKIDKANRLLPRRFQQPIIIDGK